MATYRFDHVHVIAPDPMKTAEFYENVLHAKQCVVGTSPDGEIVVELDLGGTMMKVRGPRAKPLLPGSPVAGIEHFGVQTDNIQEAVAELKSRGARILREVKESSPGVKSTFLAGPEGVLIELIEESKPVG